MNASFFQTTTNTLLSSESQHVMLFMRCSAEERVRRRRRGKGKEKEISQDGKSGGSER